MIFCVPHSFSTFAYRWDGEEFILPHSQNARRGRFILSGYVLSIQLPFTLKYTNPFFRQLGLGAEMYNFSAEIWENHSTQDMKHVENLTFTNSSNGREPKSNIKSILLSVKPIDILRWKLWRIYRTSELLKITAILRKRFILYFWKTSQIISHPVHLI